MRNGAATLGLLLLIACDRKPRSSAEPPSNTTTTTTTRHAHAWLLPEEAAGVYLGMPYAELSQVREPSRLQRIDDVDSPWQFEVHERHDGGKVVGVVYTFVNEILDAKPLASVFVDHPIDVDIAQVAEGKYGPPNVENGSDLDVFVGQVGPQWRFDSGEGYDIHIWLYGQRLIIAAFFLGSSYNPFPEEGE